jgi:regulator of sigma E protease
MSVVYFLVLVGFLGIIHEFGHFLAAKLLDFKVLRFSIGFGRPLVRLRLGETEYQLGIIPLGGYVRILGEEESEVAPAPDARRHFREKPLWQRLVVVFSGPAANLLLPVFIYFIFFAGHRELPAAVIGDVVEDGPAWRAGMQPGDQVLSVDGRSVRYWEELEGLIQDGIGRELRLRLRRGGRELDRYVVPVASVDRRRDGRSARKGYIGVTSAPFPPQIGVPDRSSPAARAGLRSGDLVVSINGVEISHWRALSEAFARQQRRSSIVYLRGTPVPGLGNVKLFTARLADFVPEPVVDPLGKHSFRTGLEASAEMIVAHVEPGSPAALAGLRPGDLLTTVDGRPVRHWRALDQMLLAHPDRTFEIGWLHPDEHGSVEAMSAPVRQRQQTVVDEYGHRSQRLAFGASNEFDPGRGVLVPIEGRLSYAVSKAVERTVESITAVTLGFWSIIRGESLRDSVGGPLMMYQVASVSGHKGWDAFFLMLALVSVSVGLINLLPIPLMDGGHVIVFALEGARQRPLSAHARDRFMLCGLLLLGVITAAALRNDVMRYLVP